MLVYLLLAAALGAESPCYGISDGFESFGGERFTVAWPPDALSVENAQHVLDWAHEALGVYQDLGFGFTERNVLIEVVTDASYSGFARTADCGGEEVPLLAVNTTPGRLPRANTVAHEVAHAAQYADMGAYLHGVASWIWWMEGSATWMAWQVDGDADHLLAHASRYLAFPELMLHHSVTAFVVPDRRTHMYGSAWLAHYIAETRGPEAVRATWAWGGTRSGERLDFREAVEATIGPFDPFWAEFLARSTVGDLPYGERLQNAASADVVHEVPASGEIRRPPEGYGFGVVRFPGETGGEALQVRVELSEDVPWVVTLVRTDGAEVGSQVLDYTLLEVVDGVATGWISGLKPSQYAWLVASPLAQDAEARSFSWEAELTDDPGPMEGNVQLVDELSGGCGCQHGAPGAVGGAWGLGIVVLLRRRRRSRG